MIFYAHAEDVNSAALLQKGFFIPDTAFANFRLGACFDNVTSKNLKTNHSNISKPKSKDWVLKGSITLNLKEFIDFFGSMGEQNLSLEFYQKNQKIHLHNAKSFYGEVGSRVTLIQIKNTSFAASVKYALSHTSNDFAPSFHQWFITTGLSQKVFLLYPYFTISFMGTNLNVHPSKGSKIEFENEDRIGITTGISLSTGSYIFLNVEGLFLNETAYSISSEVRF